MIRDIQRQNSNLTILLSEIQPRLTVLEQDVFSNRLGRCVWARGPEELQAAPGGGWGGTGGEVGPNQRKRQDLLGVPARVPRHDTPAYAGSDLSPVAGASPATPDARRERASPNNMVPSSSFSAGFGFPGQVRTLSPPKPYIQKPFPARSLLANDGLPCAGSWPHTRLVLELKARALSREKGRGEGCMTGSLAVRSCAQVW